MGVILGAVAITGLLFVALLLGTLFGGVAGWVVGLMFPFVFDALNTLTGLTLTPFETGAVLGFVAGFFRTSVSKNSNN